MLLQIKRFEELTLDELYAILKLRVDVFVVEQCCPYPELDGLDRQALHVWLADDTGIISLCARTGQGREEPICCTRQGHRGQAPHGSRHENRAGGHRGGEGNLRRGRDLS